MTFRKGNAAFATIILVLTLALGACLSDEKSDTDGAGDEVTTPNNPPTISGNPQTAVMMGNNYSFTPSASDPDGDILSFSVQNMPIWASFDSSTGSLTGVPTLGDVGLFEQIAITVSDGTDTTSLSAFSIEVVQVALGSMTLSWTPPTENTDGTTLTDLAGYRIYYGPSEGNYPNRVEINTAGLSTYVIDNVVPNTYYVVATSINGSGIESVFSNIAVKIVD